MSIGVTELLNCEAVQELLNGKFADFDPTHLRGGQGFTKFLVSPENTAGVLQEIVSMGGKKKTAKLTYIPRFMESEATTDLTDICDSGSNLGEYSTDYEVDPEVGTSVKRSITEDELHEACKNDEYYFATLMLRLIDQATRKLNATNIAQVPALTGPFADGFSGQTSTLSSGGAYVDNWIQDINEHARHEHDIDLPIAIVASGLIKRAVDASQFVDANSNGTQNHNWGRMYEGSNLLFVPDRKIETASPNGLGADHFLAMVPGALQLITFNRNEGSKWRSFINGDGEEKGILTDAVTGLRWDYRVKKECINGYDSYTIAVFLAHKLVGMPADMFITDDEFDGVTFAWDMDVVNP